MKEINVNNIDELLALIKHKRFIFNYFDYSTNVSKIFENRIENIIKDAYKNNISCTQITKDYINNKGLFDGLDYDEILTKLENNIRIRYNILINPGKDLIKQLEHFCKTDDEFFSFVYEYINDIYKWTISEMNTHDHADINDVKELNEINDKKDDVFTTGKDFNIDYPVRDYPFVIYGDEWLNWNNELKKTSHADIIDTVFGEGASLSNNLRNIENIKSDNVNYSLPIIFCDKVGDLCFIEAYQNISIEEATNIVKGKFKKVYKYNQMENYVTRLAKKNL